METFAKNEGENIYLGYLKQNTVTPFTDGAIVISYDEDRQNDNIFFEKCKDVKVENVKVFRGAGMGIVSQLCENVEIAGVAFQAGENGDEVYSTTADGLFFTNCTGKVYIHDCNIKNTMDDAVAYTEFTPKSTVYILRTNCTLNSFINRIADITLITKVINS